MNPAPGGETIGILAILTVVFGCITMAALVIAGRVALAAIQAGQARERQLMGGILALNGVRVRHDRKPAASGVEEETTLLPSDLAAALAQDVETHGTLTPDEEKAAEEEMEADLMKAKEWDRIIDRRPLGQRSDA